MSMNAGWLWFWRVKANAKAKPQALVTALQAGKTPAALEELPVDEILAALKKKFRSFTFDRERRVGEVDLPASETAFELEWTSRHFEFRFLGEPWKLMERVFAVMSDCGVPCFDLNEGRMHTVDEPPANINVPVFSELQTEVFQVVAEEMAKIDAVAVDLQDKMRLVGRWTDRDGFARAEKEAKRRLAARQRGETPADAPAGKPKTRSKAAGKTAAVKPAGKKAPAKNKSAGKPVGKKATSRRRGTVQAD